MSKVHGQSEYTQEKQRHLQMFLDGCTNGWRTLLMRNPCAGLVIIDCTSGSGHTDDREIGSPILLRRHFLQHLGAQYGTRIHQLCCEDNRRNFKTLQAIDELQGVTIQLGNYRDLVLPWLDALPCEPLFGLMYCDPNGIKPALDGIPLFRQLQAGARTQRIDLAFNFSLNAYKRHKGVVNSLYHGLPPGWLDTSLIDHMDSLASLKRYNYIRCESGHLHEWVMMYGMNTPEVRLTRRTARIIPYSEWRENAEWYLAGGLKVAPEQMRMEL